MSETFKDVRVVLILAVVAVGCILLLAGAWYLIHWLRPGL